MLKIVFDSPYRRWREQKYMQTNSQNQTFLCKIECHRVLKTNPWTGHMIDMVKKIKS